MKQVLFIANQFPPAGGSGVQRSVKFVKHLRKFGYEPIVFTRDTTGVLLKDETLLKDIPENTKIVATKAYECTELKGIFRIPGKVLGKLLVPDSSIIWAILSRKKALQLIDEHDIKIVYTTSAPYSDHLLGLYLKSKRPHIKWFVDFRDEWTNNPYVLDGQRTNLRFKIEKDMEYKVVHKADCCITNTPVMMDNFIKNNKMSGENFYFIPNGFDEEDFSGLDFGKPKNDKFTVVYTGALYGRRKPDTFFKAISNLIEKGLVDRNKFTLKLIGNYNNQKLQKQIDKLGLTGQIEIIGYVPHDICIKKQLESDCLLLLEGSGVGAEAFYTGKIFEYMNTQRPVIAVLPKGVAWNLVQESKIGKTADFDIVEDIEKVVQEFYESWENGSLEFSPDTSVTQRFERKVLTQKLSDLFDQYS